MSALQSLLGSIDPSSGSVGSAASPARRAVSVLLVVAFVLVSAAIVGVGVAGAGATSSDSSDSAATPISSCRTITEPGVYELTGTVSADGTCIEIRTSDVTFDGNGYEIAQTSGLGPGVGVVADGGTDRLRNVTVQNLTVTSFDVGVWFRGVDRSTIRDVNSSCNREEGFNVSGDYNRVVFNVAFGNHGSGFEFPSVSSDGINFDSPANNVVAHNFATHNGDSGFLFRSHTNNNTVLSNVARHNGISGFGSYNGRDTVFRNNLAAQNFGTGFSLSGSGDRLVNNTAKRNHDLGFRVYEDQLLRNNTAIDNEGVGIYVRASNTVENNTLRDNGKAGILVSESDNVVTNNTATGNGEAGIERDWYAHNHLRNNTVARNHDDSEEWEGCRKSDRAGAVVTRFCDATEVELSEGFGEVVADYRDVTAISVAVGAENTVNPSAIVIRSPDFTQRPEKLTSIDRLRSFDAPQSGRIEFLVAVNGDHYGRLHLRVTFHTPDGTVVRHVRLPVQQFPYLPPGDWPSSE